MFQKCRPSQNTFPFFKDAIDNDNCGNPNLMTEDELKEELINRGIEPTGNKEQMIELLTQMDQSMYKSLV